MPQFSEEEKVKRAFKELARLLLGPYRCNRIYQLTDCGSEPSLPRDIECGRVEGLPLSSVASAELRDRFCYGGADAYGYGLFSDGVLAAVCWFWGPQRFNDPMLWSLAEGEAILVDLLTALEHRGRGLAPVLIRYASWDMHRSGWKSLYTWMWYTHHASYHAFEKAGWRQIAWVLEIYPFSVPRAFRCQWQMWRRPAPAANPNSHPANAVRG